MAHAVGAGLAPDFQAEGDHGEALRVGDVGVLGIVLPREADLGGFGKAGAGEDDVLAYELSCYSGEFCGASAKAGRNAFLGCRARDRAKQITALA